MHLKLICPGGAELLVDRRLVLGRGKGFPDVDDISDEVLSLELIPGIEDAVNLNVLGSGVVTVESREGEAAASTSAPDPQGWQLASWVLEGDSVPVGVSNRFFLDAKPAIVFELANAVADALRGAAAGPGALLPAEPPVATAGHMQADGAAAHRSGYVLTTGVPDKAPSASSGGQLPAPPVTLPWREMGFLSEEHAHHVLSEDHFGAIPQATAGPRWTAVPQAQVADAEGSLRDSAGQDDSGRPEKRQRLTHDARLAQVDAQPGGSAGVASANAGGGSDAACDDPSRELKRLAHEAALKRAAAASAQTAACADATGASPSGGCSQATAAPGCLQERPRATASMNGGLRSDSQTAASTSSSDLVEAPFALMWIRHQQAAPFNHGCFGLKLMQVVCGKLELALVSNMAIDVPWLFSACPDLRVARRLCVVCHGGDKEETNRLMEQALCARATPLFDGQQLVVRAPPVREYGTHHSKFFILLYAAGIRVVVTTANFEFIDCNNKTQAVWYQDFPPKDAASPVASEFEDDLWEYLQALTLPADVAATLGAAVRSHDFSSARAALVASTPGYHKKTHKRDDTIRTGHTRVRWLLDRETFDAKFRRAPLVCQFSSVGSLDEKWLAEEFAASLSGGKMPDAPSALPGNSGRFLGLPKEGGMQLIWPTVEEVRQSHEGWAAGGSLPGRSSNLGRACVTSRLHRWGGAPAHRQRSVPHIKTYCRYRQNEVAWFMLGSHNLSKAAWGQLQMNSSQLFVRSFELSVLLLPRLEAEYRSHRHRGFHAGPIGARAPPNGATVSPLLRCPRNLAPEIDGLGIDPPEAPPGPLTPPAPANGAAAGDLRSSSDGAAVQARAGSPAAGTPTLVDVAPLIASSSAASGAADAGLAVSFVAANQQSAGGANGRRRGAVATLGRGSRMLTVPLPVPYTLPPEPYRLGDLPWMVDGHHEGRDANGMSPAESFQRAFVADEAQEQVHAYYADNN